MNKKKVILILGIARALFTIVQDLVAKKKKKKTNESNVQNMG